MMWRRFLLGILGLVVVIAAGWFVLTPSRSAVRSAGEPGAKEEKGPRDEHAEATTIALTAEKRQALGLKIEPVAARVPQARLNLTGKIVANPDRTVVVAPRTPGRVVKVNAQLGDTVDAGAILALVDSAEAADALAELAQSAAALALAQADQERETLLVERKIGARKDLLKAEAARRCPGRC
jgi:cobalt-zinc-cadmium efflux system membrane fusion protein